MIPDYLKAEFSKRTIDFDFEYGIYDCADEQMVFGNYVAMGLPESQPSEIEIRVNP